jgi:hypothetical protein
MRKLATYIDMTVQYMVEYNLRKIHDLGVFNVKLDEHFLQMHKGLLPLFNRSVKQPNYLAGGPLICHCMANNSTEYKQYQERARML